MHRHLAIVFVVALFFLGCSSDSAGPAVAMPDGASPITDGATTDGADGGTCATGETRCSGRCVNVQVDLAHCGMCGRACTGGQGCMNGMCSSAPDCRVNTSCMGFTYCDSADGQCKSGCGSASQCPQPGSCEMGTHTCYCNYGYHLCGQSCILEDAMSCGTSCVACTNARLNASAACKSGGCSDACNAGFNDCAGSCTAESAQSCGSSCSSCPVPSHSSPSCVNGACDFTCGDGFHKCSSECRGNTSVSSCGTSCTPCPAPGPNRKATCAGSCGTACITTCGTSCVNVDADASHCGGCNQPCAGGEVCSVGRCVLPCTGNPGFAGVLPSVGPGSGGGAVADMNGDGKPDLIIPAESPSRLLVHPGKGTGMFLPPVSLALPGLPYFAVTGDFNHDSKVDVAVTNRNSSTVDNLMVMMGNGDGTLAAPVNYALGSAALTLVTADFNGDTNLDLAITTTAASAYVLLGRADGTFQAPQAIAVATGQLGILARDLNGDGKVDLAIGATSGTTGRIYALLGRGDGTFGGAQSFPAGMHAGLLAAADFDGDAKLDLLSGDHVQGGYVRLRGNGDGTFQPPVFYVTNTVPTSELGGVATADLNHDGKADYLMTASGVLYVRHGDGAGGILGFGQQVSGVRGAITIAELNGDTNPDVVAISDSTRVALGDGTAIEAPKTFGNSFTGLFADFNNDSRLDLVSYGNFYAGNGDGTFGTGVNVGLASELAAADLNGDGNLDLLGAGSTSGAVGVRRGNGNGTFQALVDVPIGVSPSSIAVADLNGDGKKDIALTQTGTNGLAAIALGRGDGTFQPAVTVFGSTGASVVVTADFNHDGSADLAVSQNEFSGRVAFLLNNGDATFQTSFTSTLSYPRQISAGDLNGDGHSDVLITSSGQVNRFYIAYGDGAGAFTLALFDGYMNRGPNAIGDFNGDGKMDFAITSDATGAPTHVFWGTGGGNFAYQLYALGTGISTNPAMLAGDLNGDRRTDLRVGSFVLLGGCR